MRLAVWVIGLAAIVPAGRQAGAQPGGAIVPSTPLLGLIADGAPPRVRGIVGIPGAARFGPAKEFPAPVRQVLLPPSHGYVLLVRSDGVSVFEAAKAVRPETAGGKEGMEGVSIVGATPCVDASAFSPMGEAFAGYCRERGRIQVIAGLPSTPRVVAELPADRLPAPLRSIAVSDDALTVAAVTESGEGYVVNRDGPSFRFMGQANITAVSFLPRKSEFLAADSLRAEVWKVIVRFGAPHAQFLWRPEEGSGMITSLNACDAPGTVYLFAAGTARAWRMNLPSAHVLELSLPGGADVFFQLANRDSFLVSLRPGEPSWMCNWAVDPAECSLIPAATQAR